ncbi:hypothetical protein OsJ_07375 [Oryza sativa Japonica Group]|uniref:Uncharacterized protein n=1 Tax=Oryza sativa subsp. japonica TaxID=39947 RepID=B9F0V8_ORYSJ|nr:hypothetical protein OsJ_07375 [Oryza sativa Japonica Group]
MAHLAPLFLLLLLLLLPLHAAATPSAHPAYPNEPPSCAAAVPVPERREAHGGGRILDITHYYREDMPSWESDGGVGQFLWLPASMRNGSRANNSEMRLPTHTGTHVDAPGHVFQHYFDAGFDVDSLDLEVLNGLALLVDVPRDDNITAKMMESLHIPKGIQRVLFRTLNTDRQKQTSADLLFKDDINIE